MRILTYCDVEVGDIAKRLGTPEYSYHFVHESFIGALTKFADVKRVYSAHEANALWVESSARRENCVLLSFAPPNKTLMDLECPTIPVFAWEYPNLPAAVDEDSWRDDPRHDWRMVLLRSRAAITLSNHTVQAVRDSLGDAYPIDAIPTPLWEKLASVRRRGVLPPDRRAVDICLNTRLVDSSVLGLSAESLVTDHPDDGTPLNPLEDARLPVLPMPAPESWLAALGSLPVNSEVIDTRSRSGAEPEDAGWDIPAMFDVDTRLSGVVYTAVLTPSDGRKNWEDIITAFGWAFRDVDDATLVLKLGGPDQLKHHHQMLMLMSKLSPMKCRIIALHGYLDDADYHQLIGASTYYVNASLCEGLCMPLLEFLCCGIPAIAPDHTSMADYICRDFAFVIDSAPNLPTVWPHGDHQVYRTSRHQINWHSLMLAYRQSYLLAKADVFAYVSMSENAMETMRAYCSTDPIASQLQHFLEARVREFNTNEDWMNSTTLAS
jgi:glycosyltransferase involved in cell wall biosynthesis